jgi:hypothetical protein
VEVCFAALTRVFGLDGTPVKTPVGPATRVAGKGDGLRNGSYVNRLFGRQQELIEEL